MLGEFIEFPTDKSEFIYSFIILVIFMIMAVGTLAFFLRKSKIEEEQFEEEYLENRDDFEVPEPKDDLDSD